MKNNSSLVSVIATTFNRKEMLKETILSIKSNNSNFELIVVDNFSDYDFFNFIKSLKIHIVPFQNKNNG